VEGGGESERDGVEGQCRITVVGASSSPKLKHKKKKITSDPQSRWDLTLLMN
jgi:hypothetical protein